MEELWVVYMGLKLALDYGFKKVIVGLNSHEAVELIVKRHGRPLKTSFYYHIYKFLDFLVVC